MDKCRGRYAKRNKPDIEQQISHDLNFMWNLRGEKSQIHNKKEKYGSYQRMGKGK